MVEEIVAPMPMGEPQPCEGLLAMFEFEEIVKAVPVPSFEEGLGGEVHGTEYLLRKSKKKFQRLSRGRLRDVSRGERCWRGTSCHYDGQGWYSLRDVLCYSRVGFPRAFFSLHHYSRVKFVATAQELIGFPSHD